MGIYLYTLPLLCAAASLEKNKQVPGTRNHQRSLSPPPADQQQQQQQKLAAGYIGGGSSGGFCC